MISTFQKPYLNDLLTMSLKYPQHLLGKNPHHPHGRSQKLKGGGATF